MQLTLDTHIVRSLKNQRCLPSCLHIDVPEDELKGNETYVVDPSVSSLPSSSVNSSRFLVVQSESDGSRTASIAVSWLSQTFVTNIQAVRVFWVGAGADLSCRRGPFQRNDRRPPLSLSSRSPRASISVCKKLG